MLKANTGHWNKARGPHLTEVIFRNDLTREQALDLVCDSEGEVDLVTSILPSEINRVRDSAFAKLVSVDAIHVLAGVFNHESTRFPLKDVRARLALNLALDRKELVNEAFGSFATPLAGLTPLSATAALPHRLLPYPHYPEKAAELCEAVGGSKDVLRLAAERKWGPVLQLIKGQLEHALAITCELVLYERADMKRVRRCLAEKRLPQPWDVLLIDQGAQAADSVPLEVHRAFIGRTGEFRAAPVVPKFEQLYDRLARQTSLLKQGRFAHQLDRFVYDEAMCLFVCAPYMLYAVNKEVEFRPYRTTFELAETRVGEAHWSVRIGRDD